MDSHLQLSDEAFEHKFESCSLDPNLFDHNAHLRLAWIHLNKYGLEIAILNIKIQLKKFVSSIGQAAKYNETLTEAATRAVYHFILKSNSETFNGFILEFPKLNTDFKLLMDSHYSTDSYKSVEAKSNYIEPDLLAFD